MTIEGSVDQRIYLFNCEDNTVKVTGKVNTITVDKCKKTKFVFDSVISQVEGVFLYSILFISLFSHKLKKRPRPGATIVPNAHC